VTVYSVYEPPTAVPDLEARAEGLAFVRQGLSWGALLIPVIWLLYRRMWLELVLFLLLFGLLSFGAGPSDEGQAWLGWLSLALIVLLAFAANDVRSAALERRGYRLAGIAIGSGRDAAELAFFRAWLPRQQKRAERGLVPAAKSPAAAAARASSGGETGEEVIGLFPRP
jgi:hypothetical protein